MNVELTPYGETSKSARTLRGMMFGVWVHVVVLQWDGGVVHVEAALFERECGPLAHWANEAIVAVSGIKTTTDRAFWAIAEVLALIERKVRRCADLAQEETP